MVAFAVMASGITSAATLARAFGGDYLEQFVSVPTAVAALVFLAAVTAINARGIGESVKVNIGLTLIELGGLLLVIVIAVAALGDGQGDAGRAFEFKAGESVVGAMLGGAALAFYALIGFEDSVNVAEETRDPQRDYPRALFGGLLIAGVDLPPGLGPGLHGGPDGSWPGRRARCWRSPAAGPLSVPDKVFAAIALFAVANGALINLIMASRLTYGMACQGIVPSVFARVLDGRRTPLNAILFTASLCGLLVLTGDLASLADTTVLLLLVVFILVNVSVLVLRRDAVDARATSTRRRSSRSSGSPSAWRS